MQITIAVIIITVLLPFYICRLSHKYIIFVITCLIVCMLTLLDILKACNCCSYAIDNMTGA